MEPHLMNVHLRLTCLAVVALLSACGSSDGGGNAATTSAAQGTEAGTTCKTEGATACGLSGTSPAALTCASGVWQATTLCPAGSVCTVTAGKPSCAKPPAADAGSTDTSVGGDAGSVVDAAPPECTAAKDCDDKDVCTSDDCASGKCKHTMTAGATCDDGDACTDKDACGNDGKCSGSKLNCDDSNVCTDDACDKGTCAHLPVTLTTTCDDNDLCTTKDVCGGDGKCIGAAVNCDDGNPCTADACQKGQCSHLPTEGTVTCDDGNGCTVTDTCLGGSCSGSAMNCDDGNPCTVDTCASGACSHKAQEAAACDDGNACTVLDACTAAGGCLGKAKNCDDGNACTADACAMGDCTHLPQAGTPCDDGDLCSVDDKCTDKATCVGKAKLCDDGSTCSIDACVLGACTFVDNGTCKSGADPFTAIELTNADWQTYDFAKDQAWFWFQGSANDIAELATVPSDGAAVGATDRPDTVLEVLLNGKVIASSNNDDVWNSFDSDAMTVLPATGKYLVHVSTCAAWVALNPKSGVICHNAGKTVQSTYMLGYFNNSLLAADKKFAQSELEPNDINDTATTFAFQAAEAGVYYRSTLAGALAATETVDHWVVSIPADFQTTSGRPTLYLAGHNALEPFADGSSLQTYRLSVLDAKTGKVLAQHTMNAPLVAVPVTPGAAYVIRLDKPVVSGAAAPFYLVDIALQESSPKESEELTNGSMASPEALKLTGQNEGYETYGIAGDIVGGGADIDYFSLPIPAAGADLQVSCGSAFWGAGVQGLTVAVFKSNGAPLPNASATEQANGLLLKVPGIDDSEVLLKISAQGQSASVVGTSYQCHFYRIAAPVPGSCAGQCGQYLGESAACNCDDSCKKAGDCCQDLQAMCF